MPAGPTSASSSGAAPRELLSGIDSLDLTSVSEVPPLVLDQLERLKAKAQASPREVIPFAVAGETFRVSPRGFDSWTPFKLDHARGSLGVGATPHRPTVRVTLASKSMHLDGAAEALRWAQEHVEALLNARTVLAPSRLDQHVDLADMVITRQDGEAFCCRASAVDDRWNLDTGQLETMYLGKGSPVLLRIYDKLLEIRNGATDNGYLLDLYEQSGWTGEPVTRVESQVRGEILKQFGMRHAEDVLRLHGEVYLYVVGKWARLVDITSASRKERARTDARWLAVQAAGVGTGAVAGRRTCNDRHAPQLERLVPMMNGILVSVAAALGIDDPDDALRQAALLMHAYRDDNGRSFDTEARARRLEFGPSAA